MKTRRPFRRRISLQERRAKPNLRCGPSTLIQAFMWPYTNTLYNPFYYREQCDAPNPWGASHYSTSDAPRGYIAGGWNFDSPHQAPLWYGQDTTEIHWLSDSDFVYTRSQESITVNCRYSLPDVYIYDDGPVEPRRFTRTWCII